MKIQSTFIIEVEDAKFHFKTPRSKDFLNDDDKAKGLSRIFDKLIKVEGLVDENDREIGVDEIKSLDLPIDAVSKIAKAWNDKVLELMGQGVRDEEKKS